MNYKIIAPSKCPPAYKIAAEAFQTMYCRVTGTSLEIITDDKRDYSNNFVINILC